MGYEVLGSSDAPYHMKVQYWGGWGYRPRVNMLMSKLDAELPDHFQFHLAEDTGITGNFELFVYDNAGLNGAGTPVYSKKQSHKFPFDNNNEWGKFTSGLKQIMKWIWWNHR